MNHELFNQYMNKEVKLTLDNGFWYKAKIIEVHEESITFIELKGNYVSVHPKTIIMIEEVGQ